MPSLSSQIPTSEVRTARVVYRSAEGDTGSPTEVSGTVFAPTGAAPNGGWPVVVFAHGSTGIDEPCAPSLSPTLSGQAQIITAFVRGGYAVAYPDYQGLGAPGVHPFLDAHTAGLNVIDSVRALRATFPDVSNRWAAYGASQGGGAVWAANEYAKSYAPELDLVGTSALAPAADLTGLVDKAREGTLTPSQAPLVVWLLTALNRLHTELNLDDFRRGVAARYWDALGACSGPLTKIRDQVQKDIGPHDLSPGTPQAAEQLRGLLKRWALPQQPLSAPISIIYGSDDTFIDAAWTTEAIRRACTLRGTIVWRMEQGRGHQDLDGADQVQWLADRFAGQQVFNYCR
jgi:pimeloyl-ACP methyl ester carboxylesterase